MFVEGTLRWQVTEDCPWDLLMALALRDLGDISHPDEPVIPRVIPAVARVSQNARSAGYVLTHTRHPDAELLQTQWKSWWERMLPRETRPLDSTLKPPHFAAFDREL